MKNLIFRSTLLLCAIMFPIVIQATVSGDRIFIPNKQAYGSEAWKMPWVSGGISTRAIAVSNGVVYGALAGASTSTNETGIAWYNTFYYTTSDPTGTTTAWGVLNTGQTYNGVGLATDDNKNLLVAYGSNPESTTAHTKFRIYKAASKLGEVIDPTNYKEIEVHISSVGYCRYFSASGNLWDGKGYIYMTDGKKAIRVTINASGTNIGASISDNYIGHAVTLPSSIASDATYTTEDYIKPIHNGKYMLSLRSGDISVSPTTILDVDINWESGSITVPTTWQASYYQMPDVTSFKGHELYAHPYGTRNYTSSTGVYHTVTDMNGNAVKFPVAVILDRSGAYSQTISSQPNNGSGNKGCYATVNAWCVFEQIDANTMGLYMLSPYNGTTSFNEISRYDITYETYSGEIVINETDAPNRQDAVLNWSQFNHPCSGYKVEYNTNYTNASGAQTTDYVTLHENITATTATLKDIYWVLSSKKRYARTYNFRITPLKSDGTAVGHPITMSLTPKFLAIPASWSNPALIDYPGYQKCQLFWKMASYGPTSEAYYNVYRDGVKINEAPIVGYNYLDTEIKAGKHSYYIETMYLDQSATATNSPQQVSIAKRDPRKTTYSIEEIYNYRIGTGAGQVWSTNSIFSNLLHNKGVRYKQGVYYKGNWYIAQQVDGNATGVAGESAYGGVVRFSADKNKILTDEANRLFGYDVKATQSATGGTGGMGFSVGIASDEGGNLFVRRSGITSDWTATTTARQSFVFELGCGWVYLRNSDGSYNTTPIFVDLSACKIHDIRGSNANNLYYGRVDYYCMRGDLTSIGGVAYLYVSSHLSKRSNVIKLTRTSSTAITATLVDKVDLTLTHSDTGEEFKTGDENYAFPVKYLVKNSDGTFTEQYRGDYIHNLRGNVYANITPTNNPNDATDKQSVIYDTRSRINNAGGCTIGWNGEIFLITPQCTYSQNTGNFFVAMGDRSQYDASGNIVTDANGDAKMLDNYYADLSKPIPVAQKTQDELTDGSYADNNGNWIYAVHGKIENEEEIGLTAGFTDPGEANCVYIYQYIPGVRFAKYRLLPNNYFPPTPVDLVIDNIYASTEYNPTMDLIRYDGTAKFGIALNSDETSTTGNVTYDIESYTYTLQDANGNDVWTFIIKPDGTYTYTHKQKQSDGSYKEITNQANETSVTFVNEPYTSYIADNEENASEYKTHDAYFVVKVADLYRNTTYNSSVTVNYVNKDNVNDKHNSETYVDDATKDYTPIAPSVEATVAHKTMISVNDWDGDGIVNDLDNTNGIEDPDDNTDQYRVELNVDAPNTTEPVSYYKITATSPDGTVHEIKNFTLMVDGVPETDTNGNKVVRDYIPGDYNFDDNEGKAASDSPGESTLVWYHDVLHNTYSEGQTPNEWIYTITAVYGNDNPKITQSADGADAIPTNINTGIEVVYGDVEENLRAYPVPAYTTLTVKASETIKSISIYNLTGSEVLYVAGNNDTTMEIDVQSLATGYYIMRVNKMNPIKIIKK